MTEEKYNTKDIRHIDKKNQEYIAEGNRMTEEIIMFNKSDVESLEEAIKRLEQENKANLKQIELDVEHICRLNEQIEKLEKENKELKETKGRCAFKSLDNTFRDEARIKIDKLELDKDCLNVSLETARKYRGIAEVERDTYRSVLEEIREIAMGIMDNDIDEGSAYYDADQIINRISEVLK